MDVGIFSVEYNEFNFTQVEPGYQVYSVIHTFFLEERVLLR